MSDTQPTPTAWSPPPLAVQLAAERRQAANSAERRLAFLDGALYGLGCILGPDGTLGPLPTPAVDQHANVDPELAPVPLPGDTVGPVGPPAAGQNPDDPDVVAAIAAQAQADAAAAEASAKAALELQGITGPDAPPDPAPGDWTDPTGQTAEALETGGVKPGDTFSTDLGAPEPSSPSTGDTSSDTPTAPDLSTLPPPPADPAASPGPSSDDSWLPAPGEPPATIAPDEPAGDGHPTT